MNPVPTELVDVDPAGADPELAHAPVAVRKASAWLAAQRPRRTLRMAASLAVLALPLVGLVGGALVASATGSEPLGVLPVVTGFMGLGVGGWAINRAWGRTTGYARNLVQRWHALQELGVPAHEPPLGAAQELTALDRMAERVAALAADRADVRDAVSHAAQRARRLEAELGHLTRTQTGQPDVDAALDAARERLVAELARTRAQVAEVYAALLEIQAGDDAVGIALESTVGRLTAELEVDGRADAARRHRIAERH